MIDLQSAQRKAPFRLYLALLLAVGLIAGIGAGITAVALEAGWAGAAVAALVAAVSLVGVIVICVVWWRGLDEAAREAHKWAWWWGGTAGTAVGGLALLGLIAAGGPGGDLPGAMAGISTADAIRLAVSGMLLSQVAGYGVAWIVWWLGRR